MRFTTMLGACAALIFLLNPALSQSSYLDMMDDNSYNVYEVIKAAEKHFATHHKGKGSGWKDFERWRERIEPMYAPSGDRTRYNFDKAMQQFEKLRETQSSQKWNSASGYFWEPQGPDVAENYFPSAYASGVGRVEAVWGGSTNGDTIYLSSRSGGFWKTLDGGRTWYSTTQDMAAVGAIDIDVRPDAHNVVFIVSRNASGRSRGLWKSTDYGETWTQTSLNTNNSNIKKLVIPKQRPDTMYAAANNGLYRSFDGGDTWAREMTGNIRDFEVSTYDPSTLFIIKNNQRINGVVNKNTDSVLITRDALTSITATTVVPGNSGAGSRIRVTEAQPGWVYFQSSGGVWRSTDTASTFTYRGSSPANMAFGVSCSDPNLLIWGGLDQFASFDGGTTNSLVCDWVDPTSANYVHADGRVIGCWGGQIYLGTDGYLGTSNNGQNWTIVNFRGTPIREFYRIGTSITDASYIIGGSQDNGTSIRIDETWYEWYGADGMICHVDNNNSDFWFGTIQYGGLIYGEENGQERLGRRPPTNGGSWVTPSVLDPSNDNTIFIAYDSLFKSNNNGKDWELIYDWSAEGNMNEMAISPVDSNKLYISKGNLGQNGDIWRSLDNGMTWDTISTGLPGQTISRIACHPSNPDEVTIIFRGTSNGNKVFQSKNGGTTWTNISQNLPNVNGRCLVYEEGPDNRLYIGMDAGIYYIDNNTPNWTLYMDSMPAVEVNDLKVHLGAHQLIASTWGRGAWATNLVGKKDFPQVIRIDFDPSPTLEAPTEADSVHSRAVVQDPNGTVAEVKLYWGTDGFNYPNIISMKNMVGDTFATAQGIPPAPQGSRIYLRIMAVDNDNDTTWTERIVYRVNEAFLCSAAGSRGTGSDYIVNVRFSGGFSHFSFKSEYSDFRNRYYPTATRGDSYSLSARLQSVFPADSMFAWVDWNGNLRFEENEHIDMSAFDAGDESFGTIVVPMDAILDTVTMRVRNIYDTGTHLADPCGEYPGEVEDYSLIVAEAATSVDGQYELATSIFPNPTTGEFIIEHPDTRLQSVHIFDVFGKRVIPQSQDQQNGQTTIALGAVPAGLYLVKISDGQRSETIKLMKQ